MLAAVPSDASSYITGADLPSRWRRECRLTLVDLGHVGAPGAPKAEREAKRGSAPPGFRASAHSTVLRKDAAMGQDGHACMASAETSRNSFSVAPLAA